MRVFSISWWVSTFASTLVTILFIYMIKKIAEKVNIPVVNNIMETV